MKHIVVVGYLLGLPAPTLVALAAGPGMSEMTGNETDEAFVSR